VEEASRHQYLINRHRSSQAFSRTIATILLTECYLAPISSWHHVLTNTYPIYSCAPFKMSVYNSNVISALVYFMVHFFAANAASPCYMLNGNLATSEFQPCNSNLPSGSNSACCNLGKSPPDICLGGGLCQRMDSTEANFAIYAVGCTDRTGKDAACPQYCPSAFASSSCSYMQKES
jgi:hypothetical protein